MIPTKFDYVVASSVDEAIELLGRHGAGAKLLAGGHSLIPLMKFRLAAPTVLVDVGRLSDLRYVHEDGDEIAVGALTTHHMIESSRLLIEKAPLLSRTAAQIGDVQVRNRGTIGGSIVHADPASDFPAAILALEARMKIRGREGEREVSAEDFFVDMLQSAVGENEILTEIRFRKPAAGSGAEYKKVPQPASGFAIVGVAVQLSMSAGKCTDIRIGVTGIGAKAFRAREVESRLRHTSLDAETVSAACASVTEGVDAFSDIHASGDYRKALAVVYARRAIESALAAVK